MTLDFGRLGLGCAQLGNLYQAIDDDGAAATVEAAWAAGVRYFDTAPHYGLGLSERRLGAALHKHHRDEYVVSTKVGRLLVPNPSPTGHDEELFDVPDTYRRVWDFSADGVRRSLADSLERLGLDRVDLVLIHDPEGRADEALDTGYPALEQLRAEGVVRAIGVGSMDADVLTRFATGTDVDVIMTAGRYTLLEQPALDSLLPLCSRRGITVLNAAVFNGGLLAEDRPHRSLLYNYRNSPDAVLELASAIAALCERHGTTLPAAALHFAGGHPVISAVVAGAQGAEQSSRNAALAFGPPPPAALWADLKDNGLLRPDAPTPGDAA
ncbi:D-threo-aldose 1-dehydrogenase [Actinoplanes tereljensis]|uniref:Oxidoreductase n=1 Tax=Paractinoplanes tereljensis TaxID=571912 RepID=A0A919NMV6_9ACTN|nr:aldo/keto reductase [Actinoplanes tereljensis]GIF20861.1 oxidoreductase [Actinoplanes tereljensis]